MNSAEWVILEDDLGGIACRSAIITARRREMQTHRNNESSVREHVTLSCLEGLKIGLRRYIDCGPFFVLSIFGRQWDELGCYILGRAALGDAQASCTPVADCDEAKVGQESMTILSQDVLLMSLSAFGTEANQR
jgi:hypothetical protein